MPMIPEVIISMLACARIGAIHSVVFGGFAAEELASRISDVLPKVIISASCGLEPKRIIDYKKILDKALSLTSHKPLKQIIYQREQYLCKLNSEKMIFHGMNLLTPPLQSIVCLLTLTTHYIFYTHLALRAYQKE